MAAQPRTEKIQALIDAPGTVGEGQAASAALERAGARLPAVPDTRQPLSDAMVRRLPAPAKGNTIAWDTMVGGFGARVTVGGARAFVLDYRTKAGRQRRLTIGRFGDWTTGAARIRARELRRLIDTGADPLGAFEAARAAPTVAELADKFEKEHLPRKREGTRLAYQRTLNKYIRPHFGLHTKVTDVAFANIDALHQRITTTAGPSAANRTTAILSKMFSLAIRWQMRTDNPVKGIERNLEIGRKRYLDAGELVRLLEALAAHPDKQAANIIRLLMLTGARKGEVAGMRWDEVNLDTGIWTKPGSTTKQKSDHVVPLSAPALQLLNDIRAGANGALGEFVFPAHRSKFGHTVDVRYLWTKLCRTAGITNLRPHDLRHSFASALASKGASLPLIGSLLGHSKAATTHRYAHLFQSAERAATEQVGAAIVAAGNGEKKGAH